MEAVAQRTLNWLHSVLIGEYLDVNRTYSDIAQTLADFSTLKPSTDVYTFENGRSSLLLHLTGTLPVAFRGTIYSFPVSVWVPQTYPRDAPISFVTPTKEMVVRPGQHVSGEGRIYHPYLANWRSDRSSVAETMRMLQDIFSREPPVIAKQDSVSRLPPLQAPNNAPPPRPPLPPEIAGNQAVYGQTRQHSSTDQPPPPPPKPYQEQSQATPSSAGRPPPLPPHPPLPRGYDRFSSGNSQGGFPQSPGPPLRPPVPPTYSGANYQSYVVDQRGLPMSNNNRHPSNTYQSPPPNFQAPQQPLYGQQQVQPQPPFHYNQPLPQQHRSSLPPQQAPPKPPQPPVDLLSSPFDPPLPANSPPEIAPPIPPNPEKDALLSAISGTLTDQLHSTISFNNAALQPLSSQQSALQNAHSKLQQEYDALLSLQSLLDSNESILRTAMRDADACIANAQHRSVPSVDEVLVAPTVVGQQLYELVAEEKAIRDTREALGRALLNGRVSSESWVKAVRGLAREEFLKKVLVKKCAVGMGLRTEEEWDRRE